MQNRLHEHSLNFLQLNTVIQRAPEALCGYPGSGAGDLKELGAASPAAEVFLSESWTGAPASLAAGRVVRGRL